MIAPGTVRQLQLGQWCTVDLADLLQLHFRELQMGAALLKILLRLIPGCFLRTRATVCSSVVRYAARV